MFIRRRGKTVTKSSNRKPLYKQIREYIADHIRQNKWRSNDRIPSENELAAQFNVSRITIKNALHKLTEEGLIYRIQGKGSFVSADPSGEPAVYSPPETLNDRLVAYLMPRLDNVFSANLLNGIEDQLAKEGYHLLFRKTHNSKETEKELLKQLVGLRVRGIIVYPVKGETYNEELLKLALNHFPLVVVDRYLKGVETNCVCSDNAASGYEAVAHLHQLGHSRIGFVTTNYEGTTSIEDRLLGYENGLSEHSIPIEHRLRLILPNGPVEPNAAPAGNLEPLRRVYIDEIKAYYRQNPDVTAIVAVNSGVGFNVMEAAKEAGIGIPDELSVVFLDDFEYSAHSAIPPTCVSQEETNVGREAAKLLVSIIDDPRQERRKVVTPTRLIVRQSTARVKEGALRE
jgi:DNA-binding LacI/PurR family transcriptional regulator/DNA-binding transcriptional regulator YhcF (GntR family)